MIKLESEVKSLQLIVDQYILELDQDQPPPRSVILKMINHIRVLAP